MKAGARAGSLNAEDLRFFLAVRQARSIKGGARILRVDHSTVSRRLASLEETLGARLYERTPEGLVETDVAAAIAPLAERIEALTNELEDAANAARGVPSGPVRIAVSPVVAEHFLIPRLPELIRRFPDVAFDIHADISRRSLSKREADVAIRQYGEGTPPAEPSALAVKVGKLAAAAYASHEYVERFGRPARPVRSLAGHVMIRTSPSPGDTWNAALEEPADTVLSVYPFAAASAAAVAGLGIAVLPCLGSDTNPRLTRISDVLVTFDMWVVTTAEVRNNPRVRAVKDVLVEMVRAASRDLAGDEPA
jgi:DNA-binding transcriptional LysR family regulator